MIGSYDGDPGWYNPPSSTVASLASLAPAELIRRNGISLDGRDAPIPPKGVLNAPSQAATRPADPEAKNDHARQGRTKGATTQSSGEVYTCPMHPEVVSDKPGKCPTCGMKLVLNK